MPSPRAAVLSFVAVVALAVPAAAEGATVSMTRDDSVGEEGEALRDYKFRYVAGPGETNDVTFSYSEAVLTVVDAATPPKAGPGCRSVDAQRVDCPVDRSKSATILQTLTFDLGDGDDRYRRSGAPSIDPAINVDGGPGNDDLSGAASLLDGGEGNDVLTGGAERDLLAGGPGDDRVSGAEGDDALSGGPGNDELDGGAGAGDLLSYQNHTAGVVADLRATTAGAAEERDSITGFESLTGGDGDDRLTGTDGANTIDGGKGADVLTGLGGDDNLAGERIAAGAGNDYLDETTSAPDCGAGTDLVGLNFKATTVMPRNCERIEGSGPEVGVHGRATRGALRFKVFHVLTGGEGVIRLTVRDRRGRAVLGRGRARVSTRSKSARCGAALVARCDVTTVRVALTRAGRRAVRRGKPLRITYRDYNDDSQTFTSKASI